MANYRAGANGRKPVNLPSHNGRCRERQGYDAKSRGNKWHQVVHRESSVEEKRQLKRKFLLFIAVKYMLYSSCENSSLRVPLIPPIIFCFSSKIISKNVLGGSVARKLLRRLEFYGLFFVIFIHNGALTQRNFAFFL